MAAELLAQTKRDSHLRGRSRRLTQLPSAGSAAPLVRPQPWRYRPPAQRTRMGCLPARSHYSHDAHALEAGSNARTQRADDRPATRCLAGLFPSGVTAVFRDRFARCAGRSAKRRRLPEHSPRASRRSFGSSAVTLLSFLFPSYSQKRTRSGKSRLVRQALLRIF